MQKPDSPSQALNVDKLRNLAMLAAGLVRLPHAMLADKQQQNWRLLTAWQADNAHLREALALLDQAAPDSEGFAESLQAGRYACRVQAAQTAALFLLGDRTTPLDMAEKINLQSLLAMAPGHNVDERPLLAQLEQLDYFLLSCDADGRIFDANDRWLRTFAGKRPPSDLFALLPVEFHPVFRQEFGMAAQGAHGRPFELAMPDKDGQLVLLEARFAAGKTGSQRLILRDISAQKEQELWLSALLNNMDDGVLAMDMQGRLTYMNREAEHMLGWRFIDMHGQNVHELIHHHLPNGDKLPLEDCVIYRAQQEKRTYRSEDELFFRKDGAPLRVCNTPLLLNGKLAGSVTTFADVSEAREREEQMRQAKQAAEKAARAKSEFLATMSHEIRTPLNGVIGMIELLNDTPLDAEQSDFVRTIKMSADTLLSIINDILDFSKIEADGLEIEAIDFSLRQLLEGTLDIVASKAHSKGLTLASFATPDVPDTLCGDPTRLRQILLNLLSNAIKFTENGMVLVSATLDHREGGTVQLRLCVKDTGIGLSPTAKERLFQPFAQADSSTTRKYGGTGLGLAICKRLAEAMGGAIGVESLQGEGSEFWVSLPLPATGNDSCLTARDDPSRHLVMIAGDSPDNRALWSRYLDSWNVPHQTCASLAGLLEALRDQAAAGRRPDTLLLIEPLPDATLEQAAQMLAVESIPMVACLQEPDGKRKNLLAHQGLAVLHKPMKQSALLDALLVQWAPSGIRLHTPDKNAIPPSLRADRHYRLLLAEDNPVNQRVAASMLHKMGFMVDVVSHGGEALQAIGQQHYDAILMDCQMPEMDGYEATRAIRKLESEKPDRRRLPIIAMTANAMEGDRALCLEAGMDDYLAKPIEYSTLETRLAQWLPHQPGVEPPAVAPAPKADRNGFSVKRLTEFLGDDPVAIAEMLEIFRDSLERWRQRLRLDLQSDGGHMVKLAHELKGSAANVGADTLATLATQLYAAAKDENRQALPDIAARIETEMDAILVFIAGYGKE